jgi:hypothetical protein
MKLIWQCILALSLCCSSSLLQDMSCGWNSVDFGDNQLASQGAAFGRGHPLLDRMRTIERRGKKNTMHMNFKQHDEKEEEKDEEIPAKKKSRVYADKSHGKKVCRQLPTME